MKPKGFFISLEGGEGVGKSTVMQTIQAYLTKKGRDHVLTHEPGGTPMAETLRDMVLHAKRGSEPLMPNTELLLLFAARAQHVTQVIYPALVAGKVVVCDRFTDASYAYQGAGRGIETKYIDALSELVHGSLWPDLTLLLDASPELGRERMTQRGQAPDRIEQETLDFFSRVHACYRERATQHHNRFRLIDASLPLASVQTQVRSALAEEGL